jgi:hypothetical protein
VVAQAQAVGVAVVHLPLVKTRIQAGHLMVVLVDQEPHLQ